MAWPIEWDRGSVLAAIEEASGAPLPVDAAIADTLIAKAQELGLVPQALKLWIYDEKPAAWAPPGHDAGEHWTAGQFETWARRMHLTEPLAICAHCEKRLYTKPEIEAHACDENGNRPTLPPGGITA